MNSDEVVRAAKAAGPFIARSRELVDLIAYKPNSERLTVSRALLTSSLDHALSISFLLRNGQPAYANSAATLFRIQLDHMMRGTFFSISEESPDAEVATFITDGEMPKRQKGNPYITLNQLCDVARDELKRNTAIAGMGQVDLSEAYKYTLKRFNDLVHGGNLVTQLYEPNGQGLIFRPLFEWLVDVTRHSGLLAFMAVTCAIVRLADPEQIQVTKEWEDAYHAFLKYKPPIE